MWNTDVLSIPRGEVVTNTITLPNGKTGTFTGFAPVYIWAASKCGIVTKSYYTSTGRLVCFDDGELPIAWQPFIVPEFPEELLSAEVIQ